MDIGLNIKLARKSKGLTQDELAIKLHIHRSHVSKWERGANSPGAEKVRAIAEALGVPISAIYGDTWDNEELDDLLLSPKMKELQRQLIADPSLLDSVMEIIETGILKDPALRQVFLALRDVASKKPVQDGPSPPGKPD